MKAHVSRLLDKLGVDNRVQVALLVHDADLGWGKREQPAACSTAVRYWFAVGIMAVAGARERASSAALPDLVANARR